MTNGFRYRIPRKCPNCGAGRKGKRGMHWNLKAIWCLNCSWGVFRKAEDK